MLRECKRARFHFNGRRVLDKLIFVAPMLFASAVAAQTPRCTPENQVGWIGITGLECNNCEMSSEAMRFSTEPRITGVAPGSIGSGQLRAGDVIMSVNGSLITTSEGGSKLANLKPGQRLTLVIRRDDQILQRTFESLPARCGGVLGMTAVGGRGGSGEPMIVNGGRDTLYPSRSRRPGAASSAGPAGRATVYTPRPDGVLAAANATSILRLPPPGFGFSIACSDCRVHLARPVADQNEPIVWEFRSAPEIYSVESNSAAWRAGLRRGDVITHIDGIAITRDEAGRKFGSVKPGQLVRLTFRRNNDARTISLRGEAPRTDAREPLRNARALITEMAKQGQEERQLVRRLVERALADDASASRELVERINREQIEQNRRLTELTTEIARAERMRQDVAAATTERTLAPTIAQVPTTTRTVRYAGRLGNTDIEVRGGSPVIVNETEDTIVIQIGATIITLKKR